MAINNRFYLVLILPLLFLISCSKAKIAPSKITQLDTTKKTDTTKTLPTVTLPAGVATTFTSNSSQWLINMHSDGGNESSTKNSIGTDAAGNIYMLFNFYGALDLDPGTAVVGRTSYALDKATLAKYSPAGQLLWSKVFESDGVVYADGMQVDQVGNIYCSMFCTYNDTYVKFDGAAHTLKQVNGSNVILKFNTSGTMQWFDEMACSAYETRGYNELTGFAVDAQGNVYVGGSFLKSLLVYDYTTTNTINASDPNTSNAQYVIVKCDNNGKYVSSKTLFITGGADPYVPVAHIAVDNNQNVYLSGYIEELNPITGPIQIGNIAFGSRLIAKYDKNWNWIWVRNDPDNWHYCIKADASGNIYSTGFSFDAVDDYAELNKISTDGNLIWSKSVLTDLYDAPQSLSITSNGSVIMAYDFNPMGHDPFLSNHSMGMAKYDAGGNLVYSKKLTGYTVADFSTEYGIASDNTGNLNLIGSFRASLKYFSSSSDPVYPISDQYFSFFIAHFPDKP